jgi:hypothetical protein
MRSIPILPIDAAALFDEIAAAKRAPRGARMRAARASVIAAYQQYESSAPEVGGLVPAQLTAVQQEALRHAYMVETEAMNRMREQLLLSVLVAQCPFCGIGEARTLDHYLPKERFPEFSVLPINLVPSCPICNNLKRDRVLNAGTDIRMFVHPYFDVVPNVDFMVVNARLEENALILAYRLQRPAEMHARTFRRLQSHFEELDLADRYRRMGLNNLGEQYPALSRTYGQEALADRVAEKLLEVAQDYEASRGPNHWLAKLYRALASLRAFCDGGFEVVRLPQ